MKFRAVMDNLQYIREFQNLVLSISKLSKECLLSISPTQMTFVANEMPGTVAPLVWLEIDGHLYFTKYNMEGPDDDSSHILLSLSPSYLARALGTQRQNVQPFKMKLAHIQIPCFIIESLCRTTETSRKITHHVPIKIIARKYRRQFAIPQVPKLKLVLNAPFNRLMRSLIDKMKNISSSVVVYASSKGEMNIVAETETATVTTCYSDLKVQASNEAAEDAAIEASCAVECKKMAQFFSALNGPALELWCGIADDHLIHMKVNVRQGVVIQSILPALCV